MLEKKYRYNGYDDAIKRYKQSEQKEMSFQAKLAITVAVLLCILVVAVLVLYQNLIHNTADSVQYKESSVCTYDESDGIHILILGTDERVAGDAARSDMIMICSLDTKKETMQFVSLQRDLYVTIPGREGRDRLAHAFAYGQGELAAQTIEENFDIELDGYVVVNLASSLYQVIDAFGGTQVELTLQEAGMINGYIFELNNITGSPYGTSYIDETTEGTVILDGRQAISYARIRYIGTDVERTSRQREVMIGMLQNFKNELLHGNVMAAIDLYKELPKAASNITTSVPKEELKKIIKNAFVYTEYKINTDLSFPVAGDWWDATTPGGMAVIEWNVEETLKKFKDALGIKETMQETVEETTAGTANETSSVMQ